MEKKQKRGTGFAIWTGLTALVFAALLELNKNTLLAWGECAAVLLVYVLLWRQHLRGARFWKRALAWLGLAAVLTLVLLGVGRPYKPRPAVAGETGGLTEPVTVAQG